MGIFFNASLKKIPFRKMHIAIMLLLLFLISKGSKWGEGVKDLGQLLIKSTFSGSLECPLYSGLTVHYIPYLDFEKPRNSLQFSLDLSVLHQRYISLLLL
jgi:hypothetical protein